MNGLGTKKFGHLSRWDPKPRATMLAKPAAAYYYARKLKEIQKQYYDSFRSTRQKIL
jgi:hypothetical protein